MIDIEKLEQKVASADKAYRDGTPIMSDGEFDQLEDMLRAQKPNSSILSKLNDRIFGEEEPLTIHMGSQNKALTLDELDSFLEKTSGLALNVSQKLDGMSLELTYKKGRLVKALTRGLDGRIGVNITSSIIKVPSVPKNLAVTKNMVVRGELMLSKSNLKILNSIKRSEGSEEYSNTRNGVVGIAKHEKNRKFANLLIFKAFDLLEI